MADVYELRLRTPKGRLFTMVLHAESAERAIAVADDIKRPARVVAWREWTPPILIGAPGHGIVMEA